MRHMRKRASAVCHTWICSRSVGCFPISDSWLNFRPSPDSKGIKSLCRQRIALSTLNYNLAQRSHTNNLYITYVYTSSTKPANELHPCYIPISCFDSRTLIYHLHMSTTTIYNAHRGLLGSRHFEESVTSASEMMQHFRATTLTSMILALSIKDSVVKDRSVVTWWCCHDLPCWGIQLTVTPGKCLIYQGFSP